MAVVVNGAAVLSAARNAKSPEPLDPVQDEGLPKESGSRKPSKTSDHSSDKDVRLRRISKDSEGSATKFAAKLGRQPSQVLEDIEKQAATQSTNSKSFNVNKIGSRGNANATKMFDHCESMPAVVLMNNGRFDDLTPSDIEDLFSVIDRDNNGMLDFEEIRMLLKEVIRPPCTDEQIDAIYALTDQNEDGNVRPEELLSALQNGPLKSHMKQLQKENKARKKLEELLGLNAEVDRDLMLERLKWIVSRDDSFRTLPFSLLYLCIFIYLVVAHLRIWDRQQVEAGLQSWVMGYGGGPVYGPYLESVSDVPGMWSWMNVSGLRAIYGNCRNNTASLPKCQVGTRHVLLSDVKLKMRQSMNGKHYSLSEWLLALDIERTQRHLQSQPLDYLGASRLALEQLWSQLPHQRDVTDLQLSFSTYAVQAQLFATTTVDVHFTEFGQAVPDVTSTAVLIRPYPIEIGWKVMCFVMDGLYAFFLLFPMYAEMKDLFRGMRVSGISDGFVSYWGLWNGVDWVSITTGTVNITLWLLCFQAMMDSTIHDLLEERELELLLTSRAMLLDADTLESLQLAFDRITSLFFCLHCSMGLTGVAIMLKFFKAFQANPRLQLVTDTLVKAANDIFHFSVVFMLVFLGFAVTGHILLGSDMDEFRSFGASVDTAFVALMGEFGWYAEISKHDQPQGSGLPRFVMVLWFWLYMVFVLLILINMLLAIVLEHYTQLRREVMNSTDAPALWQQCLQYLDQASRTKRFINNAALVHMLEDDDTPCHPDSHVSQESLLAAFPGMMPQQAAWLMKWLRGEAIDRMRAKDDQVVARLKIMESFVESVAKDLHVVNLNVAVCTSKLEEGSHLGTGAQGGFDSGLADQLTEQVDRLNLTVGGAVRDLASKLQGVTDGLAKKTAKLKERPGVPAISFGTFSPEGGTPVVTNDAAAKLAAKEAAKAALQKSRQTPQTVPICFQE